MTAIASAVLLPLLMVTLFATPRLDALLTVHAFVGVALLGPLALKLASVGYRFVRYYTGSRAYIRKGPPRIGLLLLAIPLVLTTAVLMASGIGLLVTGPSDPGPFVLLHNATFVLWLPIATIHVVAYVGRVPVLVREAWSLRGVRTGGIDLTIGAALAGVIAAIALLPVAVPWASPDAFAQGLRGPVIAGAVLTALALVAAGALSRSPASR